MKIKCDRGQLIVVAECIFIEGKQEETKRSWITQLNSYSVKTETMKFYEWMT